MAVSARSGMGNTRDRARGSQLPEQACAGHAAGRGGGGSESPLGRPPSRVRQEAAGGTGGVHCVLTSHLWESESGGQPVLVQARWAEGRTWQERPAPPQGPS